jgi:hypothetical protein
VPESANTLSNTSLQKLKYSESLYRFFSLPESAGEVDACESGGMDGAWKIVVVVVMKRKAKDMTVGTR